MRNSLNITSLQKLRAAQKEHAVSVSGYKSKVCILYSVSRPEKSLPQNGNFYAT